MNLYIDDLQAEIHLFVFKDYAKQVIRDAYDSAADNGLYDVRAKELNDASDPKSIHLQILAVGKRDNLDKWGQHLNERWGFASQIQGDKHKADRQWITVNLTVYVGGLYISPISLSIGPKMLFNFHILLIGFEYGKTKPKALLSLMFWNGNNKLMWSAGLLYMMLEYMKIGEGAGGYHLF